MSSATRKKACSHSMHQPSASALNLVSTGKAATASGTEEEVEGLTIAATASATASPRLSLPPGTLKSSMRRV